MGDGDNAGAIFMSPEVLVRYPWQACTQKGAAPRKVRRDVVFQPDAMLALVAQGFAGCEIVRIVPLLSREAVAGSIGTGATAEFDVVCGQTCMPQKQSGL